MTTQVAIVDTEGKQAGSVELPASIFDVQTNVPLIHQVVVAQLAAARQGTHSTKGRGDVSGSGAKPFKQKGTGRARQGSIRMPQHRGGGIVHGPTPRDYSQRTPKKMIAAALGVAKNVLIVLDRSEETASLTVRNLPEVHVLTWDQLNAYDVLVSDDLVFTKTAYEAFVAAKSPKAPQADEAEKDENR